MATPLKTYGQTSERMISNETLAYVRAERASTLLSIRLKIPKIQLDAAIESVGLTPEGGVAVPAGPSDVAWFDVGPRPGESGTAVIVGHYGWKDGIPAVFDDLSKLQKGDKIFIEDENGTAQAFVVRARRTYGENESAADIFTSNDGKAHLNLITCGGTWNEVSKTYSERIVVFTDKV
jgi:sortase A